MPTPAPLRNLLGQLEAFRWAFLEMFPSIRLTAPVPSTVVVFKDWDAFTKFQPRDASGKRSENVAGYFTETPGMIYMVTVAPGDGADFGRTVIFHEFTHYILHRNLHDMPRWLDEGLSEYYSTLKIETNRIVIGSAPSDRLKVLRRASLLPLERMLSPQGAVRIFQNETDTERFYAQSWALVHYLSLGNHGKRRNALGDYIVALQRGLSIEQAFQSAFACGYDDLERELQLYLHGFAFPALVLNRPAMVTDAIGAPERMTESDAESLQADLLVRAGATFDAERRLAALLARDPSLASARLSLALLRLQQGRGSDALTLLRDLARTDSGNAAAHIYLATVLAESGLAAEALQAAERATVLNGQSPYAWWSLALAASLADRPAQADAAMSTLLQLDPNPAYHQRRAYVAFRLGKDASALRDALAFLQRAGWGHEAAPSMAFLAAMACRRMGEAAEAVPVLEQARAVIERGSWTEKVLDFFQGRLVDDELVRLAKEIGELTEAHIYVGFHDGFAGRREQALAHFRWVRDRGSRNFNEYSLALAELARLEQAGQEPR